MVLFLVTNEAAEDVPRVSRMGTIWYSLPVLSLLSRLLSPECNRESLKAESETPFLPAWKISGNEAESHNRRPSMGEDFILTRHWFLGTPVQRVLTTHFSAPVLPSSFHCTSTLMLLSQVIVREGSSLWIYIWRLFSFSGSSFSFKDQLTQTLDG